MKNYLVALLLFFCIGNITAQNYHRISKKILKHHRQMTKFPANDEKYYELRKETKIIEKLHNKQERDTIYLLELHPEPADPYLYTLGWNRTDTIFVQVEDYLGRKEKEFVDVTNDTFPKYMCELVSKWDYEELKKEGKLHPAAITVGHIVATRIIINKRKYSIDCIDFTEFFFFERDYIYPLSKL